MLNISTSVGLLCKLSHLLDIRSPASQVVALHIQLVSDRPAAIIG